MPPDGLPLVVTSGLGIGVFAGVVSGICYVFLQGYRSRPRLQYGVITSSACCVCGAPFTQAPAQEGASSGVQSSSLKQLRRRVQCAGCHGRACRGGPCSAYVRRRWLCSQCRAPTPWIAGLLARLPTNPLVRMSKQLSGTTEEAQSLENVGEKMEEKEIVRDFIERLVGSMLEANLDDTSVNRLYRDPEYDAMFERHHGNISTALTELGSALHVSISNLPITGQTPCSAHATLKAIIRRVLRDASNMPLLTDAQEADPPQDNSNQTYEDLLATAILNKVIDNYQHSEVRRSSSTSSGGTYKKPEKPPKQPKQKKNKQNPTPVVCNVTTVEDAPWKPQELDATSVSSVEDWCRSESSYGSKHIDPISLTIQHSIEEISSTSEDDQYRATLSRNSFRSNDLEVDREDWQDNWLFSRKGRGSPKPVPVPMLVPSPSTEFRALIGDRDADDTTDLSETGSDMDDTDTISSIKNILVDSRTVIGGKNLLENINPELLNPEDLEQDLDGVDDDMFKPKDIHVDAKVIINGQNEVDDTTEDFNHVSHEVKEDLKLQTESSDYSEAEAKNELVIEEIPYEESDSFGSNTERDAEYTEKYASFPRPIKKNNPELNPRVSDTNEIEQIESLEQNNGTKTPENSVNSSDEEEEPPLSLKGSYSEREKEKWRNPIALENNPYSKENLDKRLQCKSPDNHIFGRDYYIRDAKRSNGGKDKPDEESSEGSRNDLPRPKSLPVTNSDGHFNDRYVVDPGLFTARPAIVDEEPVVDGSLHSDGKTRPHSLALSSDSDDLDVKRVYEVGTGKIHKYKDSDLTKSIKQSAKSPVGIKQFIVDEMLSPSTEESKFDENHNTYTPEPVMKISSIKDLQSVGVLNVPSYEEKSCTIELSDEFSLDSQKGSGDSVENVEMRESSKKYLNSLVKGKPVYNIYPTPPVSIYEKIEDGDSKIDGNSTDVGNVESSLPVRSVTRLEEKPKECNDEEEVVDGENNDEGQNEDVITETIGPVRSRTKLWNEKCDQNKPNEQTDVSKSPILEELLEDSSDLKDDIEPICHVKSRTKMWNDLCETSNKHNDFPKSPIYDPFIAVCPPKPQDDQIDFPLPNGVPTQPHPINCIDLSRIPYQSLSPPNSPDRVKSKSCADVSSMEEPHKTFLEEDFVTLKEKKIVSHFKQDFAKSVPNIQECDESYFVKKTDRTHSAVLELDELEVKPSVKDLRKLFDKEENKVRKIGSKTSHLQAPKASHKQVHSLTARSIPAQVRIELQNKNESTITEKNDVELEENEEEMLKQLPKCRSKIQFFELLEERNK